MSNLYSGHSQHLLALDNIIFGFDGQELKMLMIKRGFEPEKGNWSLMGGFLKANESLDDGAERILKELTGLTGVYMEQLFAYGDINRDPIARTVSIAYYALIKVDSYNKELAKRHGAQWFTVTQHPQLIFDHEDMVEKALGRLRRRTRTEPIGFELLPEKFTIPQLRSLYEAINQTEYDPRNFSKKLHSMKLLTKLEEKDKSSSRKGAYLYKFDKSRYEELRASGFNFGL